MYIKIGNEKYSCSGIRATKESVIYFGLPEDTSIPPDEDITLCSDSGEIMRTDERNRYLRQVFVEGNFMLTNTPEPEPLPEIPEGTGDDLLVTWGELAKAYTEGVNSIDE